MKERVFDAPSDKFTAINEMGVTVCWGLVHILVGQCRLCRSVFINGKRVPHLYVETKEYCDHQWKP